MSDVGYGGSLPAESPRTAVPAEGFASPVPEGAGGPTTADQSTSDTAKQQAGQLAQDAKESGKHVAGTAVDEGRQVLDEGRRQVKDLAAEARQQVDEQSRNQKDKATAGLRDLADELEAIGSGNGGQSGLATDLAQQAATHVHDVAGWLESRNPGELIDELRGVARRHPGTFLLGALAAGVLAGRLTRGAVDAARSDTPSDPEPRVDLTSPQVASVPPVESGVHGYTGLDDPYPATSPVGATR
jgi:polyhydroxyalkanoate synthesis regulator phasin